MHYCDHNWLPVLRNNQLDSFDALWQLDAPWFEEPNVRRGGWSGVVKHDMTTDNDLLKTVFIKRQANHMSRTWRHPVGGIPTFQKEFHNLNRFYRYDIPTMELIYFGRRFTQKEKQAILITKALTGYVPLDKVMPIDTVNFVRNTSHRRALIRKTAQVLRRMHQHRIQHNSLYPKHIFVKPVGDGWDVRLIDLEKAKRKWRQKTATLRDIGTFRRHTLDWSTRDHLLFFQAYVNESSLSSSGKQLWHAIQDRLLRKSK